MQCVLSPACLDYRKDNALLLASCFAMNCEDLELLQLFNLLPDSLLGALCLVSLPLAYMHAAKSGGQPIRAS